MSEGTAGARQGGGRARRQLHIARRVEQRTLNALVVFGLLIACAFLLSLGSPSTAAASPIPADSGTFAEDLQAFETMERDVIYPGTPEWDALDSVEQDQALRGFSDAEWLADAYTGSAGPGLDEWASHFTSAEASEVADTVGELTSGMGGLVEGGASDIAVGGGALDAAVALGVVASVPSLISIGSVLAYQDVTTGTNVVYTALFSGKEDYSALEAAGGVAAEKMRWQLLPQDVHGYSRCAEHGYEVGLCAEAYYEHVFPSEPYSFEHGVHAGAFTHVGCCGSLGVLPDRSEYFLEPKVEGYYYFGAESESTEGGAPWGHEGPYNGLSGFPKAALESHPKVATELFIFGPRNYWHFPENPSYDTSAVRTPSRFHIGLPHKTTVGHMEGLEGEGHEVQHVPGKELDGPELKSGIEKLVKKVGEGGQKSLGKAVCHLTGCETRTVPAEPETPFDEAQPEKPSGVVPVLPGYAIVPDCFLVFTTGATCKSEIEESGFTSVELDVLTWEHAVVTQPAEAALSVEPAAGSEVETSSKIVIDANPSIADFPVFVPAPARETETGTEFAKELEELGWTKVTTHVLTEPDPSVGPEESPYTDPSHSTRIDPSGEPEATPVEVFINPSGSPSPGLPSGASPAAPGCGLSPPTTSIDMTPITSQRFGSAFPFSLLPWISESVSGIAVGRTEPHFVLHVFGSEVETGNGFEPLATVFTLVRDTIAAFMWLGVAWFLWNRTIGTRTS